MPIEAYLDNFADVSAWTHTSSNNVKAIASAGKIIAAANGTVADIRRAYDGAATSLCRIGFDITVDKTNMGTNYETFVGTVDTGFAFQGTGCFLKQGVGIGAGLYYNYVLNGSVNVAVAWASLVDGATYHVEISVDSLQWRTIVRVYDSNGTFLGTNSVTAANSSWYLSGFIKISNQSIHSGVSAIAYDPSMAGSATSGPNLKAPVRWQDSNSAIHYYPGGGNITRMLFHTHAAGVSPGNIEFMTDSANSGGGPYFVNTFLSAGWAFVAPFGGTGGDQNWGKDTAATDFLAGLETARGILGAGIKYAIFGRSMGGLMAGRLIGYEDVQSCIGLYLRVACLDIAALEQGVFQTNIDTAWGISAQASYAAAQATLFRADPLQLLNTYPSKFRAVGNIFVDRSTADAVVPDTSNSLAFVNALTANGVPFKQSVSASESHGDPITLENARKFLRQIEGRPRPIGLLL